MLRGLVVTHGELGGALIDAAFLIMGGREGVEALSNREFGRERLVEALLDRFRALPAGDGLLVMVDAPGAGPHVAARLALSRLPEEERPLVLGPVTGVNLPLLLTFLNRRETTPAEDLLPLLLDRGRAGILVAD
jgi:mannose/fructose-specific phosphotransferase system component IIA